MEILRKRRSTTDRSPFWYRSHSCDRSQGSWYRSQLQPFPLEPTSLEPIARAIDRMFFEIGRIRQPIASEPSPWDRYHLGEIGRKQLGIGTRSWDRSQKDSPDIGTMHLRPVAEVGFTTEIGTRSSRIGTRSLEIGTKAVRSVPKSQKNWKIEF